MPERQIAVIRMQNSPDIVCKTSHLLVKYYNCDLFGEFFTNDNKNNFIKVREILYIKINILENSLSRDINNNNAAYTNL